MILVLQETRLEQATEEVWKNSMNSEIMKQGKCSLLKMMHVASNCKERKRRARSYADVMKLTHTQPLVLENKSSHANNKNGQNQVDLEKIKYMTKNSTFYRIAKYPRGFISEW